jgi:hypothetical protein
MIQADWATLLTVMFGDEIAKVLGVVMKSVVKSVLDGSTPQEPASSGSEELLKLSNHGTPVLNSVLELTAAEMTELDSKMNVILSEQENPVTTSSTNQVDAKIYNLVLEAQSLFEIK